jgi:hypothetical protein
MGVAWSHSGRVSRSVCGIRHRPRSGNDRFEFCIDGSNVNTVQAHDTLDTQFGSPTAMLSLARWIATCQDHNLNSIRDWRGPTICIYNYTCGWGSLASTSSTYCGSLVCRRLGRGRLPAQPSAAQLRPSPSSPIWRPPMPKRAAITSREWLDHFALYRPASLCWTGFAAIPGNRLLDHPDTNSLLPYIGPSRYCCSHAAAS